MVVRAPVLGSGPGLSAPAPARREFSGEARKPEASRNCPSLSSQAVNASAASCTGNERPCCMRHRPLTTLESFLSSRCNTQRQGKKESSISFTFTSRTTQCLADFCLAPPSSPLPLLTLLLRPLYSISQPSPPLALSSDRAAINRTTNTLRSNFGSLWSASTPRATLPPVCATRPDPRSSRPPAKTTPAVGTPSSFQPCRPSFLLPFSAFFSASTGLSWGDAIRSGHRPNARRKTVSELKHESRHGNDHNARYRAIRLASRERRWIPAGSAIRGAGATECHFFADDRRRNRRRRRQRWAEGCKLRQEAERILSFRRGIASGDGADRRIVSGANTTTPRALSEARELDREHQRLNDGTSTPELNEQKSRTLPYVARLLPPHELPEAASPARCRSPTNHEPTSGVVNAGGFSGGGRQ